MIGLFITLFVAGWATQGLTLFDVGRYSFPLIYFAAVPFCYKFNARSFNFLAFPILSSFFAVMVAFLEGADSKHILSQSILQCLAILFAGGVASIDWRKHLDTLSKCIVGLGIPIVAYAGYQMAARIAHWPFAFLPITNQQYYIDGGLQRDWDKAEVTRASSVFSEPSELGFYCLWLVVLGLACNNGRLRIAAMLLGCTGILFSQSLSAVLGGFVVLIAYLLSHRVSSQTLKQIAVMGILTLSLIGLMKPLAPEAFDRLSDRLTQAATLDERADSGRVDHLPACWRIFSESPVWGHGISSLAAATSSGSDVTTVNYAMLLMERGLIGTIFFLVPWITLTFRVWRLPEALPGRSMALLLMVMTLYSFWNFSLTYFLPFWFALGFAASIVNSHTSRAIYGLVDNRTLSAPLGSSFGHSRSGVSGL
jgi:O-Antigen ligase